MNTSFYNEKPDELALITDFNVYNSLKFGSP